MGNGGRRYSGAPVSEGHLGLGGEPTAAAQGGVCFLCALGRCSHLLGALPTVRAARLPCPSTCVGHHSARWFSRVHLGQLCCCLGRPAGLLDLQLSCHLPWAPLEQFHGAGVPVGLQEGTVLLASVSPPATRTGFPVPWAAALRYPRARLLRGSGARGRVGGAHRGSPAALGWVGSTESLALRRSSVSFVPL